MLHACIVHTAVGKKLRTSRDEVTSNSEEIKPRALSIVEATVSQSAYNSGSI